MANPSPSRRPLPGSPLAAQQTAEAVPDKDSVVASFSSIKWDDFGRTLIDASEVAILKKTDANPLDYVLNDAGDSKKLASTLLKLLKDVSDPLVVKYSLTHIEDILTTNLNKYAPLFSQDGRSFDAQPFLRQVDKGDIYSKKVAASCLALLFQVLRGDLDSFLSLITGELSNSKSNSIRVLVPALSVLLRNETARLNFGQVGGVGYMTKLLKLQGAHGQAQTLYELVFCIWTLSFHEQLKGDFIQHGTVPVLAEQVSAAPREKVVRVALAALRNLCYGRLDVLNAEMIACGLPKTLENLLERKWSDAELKRDLEYLHEALQKDARDLSTYERYVAEVNSGQLRWGVVHTEKFWRENIRATETNDFKTIRSLISLLASQDEEVVSIACYDIGEFSRFYPNGRSIVKLFGAKDRVMELIGHDNAEVARYALQCVSKIMVNKWEFVRG